MELDATTRGNSKAPSKKEMDRCREKKLCFKCGSAEHMSGYHRQGANRGGRKTNRGGASRNTPKKLEEIVRRRRDFQINTIGRRGYQPEIQLCATNVTD